MAGRRNHIEEDEQVKFFDWLRYAYPNLRAVSFAIPNGGKRNPREGARLKRQGVTAGAPDIGVFFTIPPYHGLFIEMKAPKVEGKSKPSVTPAQKQMLTKLNAQGYKAEVCFGFAEAQKVVEEYMDMM